MRDLFLPLCLMTVVVSAAVLSGSAWAVSSHEVTNNCTGPLRADFATYWLSARQLLLGGDPYNPAMMRAFAASLGCQLTGPTYIFPWFLMLLFPFAALPLDVAAGLWFLLNLVMVVDITTWTLRNHCGTRPPRPTVLLALATSPGVLLCLVYGQFGIVCLWGMSIVARTFRRERYSLALALIIGSLKPHIGWLYWILVGRLLVEQGRFRTIARTAFLTTVSVLFIILWAPGSYDSWRQVYGSALSWMGASVATPLRLLAASSSDPAPLWPVVSVMILALIFAGFRLGMDAKKIDLSRDLPWLVAISICSAPYVWSLDFCVLLPAEVIVLSVMLPGAARRGLRQCVAPALVILARLGLFAQLIHNSGDWRTWWYPPVITIALFYHLSRVTSARARV